MCALQSRRLLIPSMALALLLAMGFMTAVWFGFSLWDLFSYGWRQRSYSDQLVFTVEGEPLLSTHLPDNPTPQTRTLDGKLVEDPQVTAASGGDLPPGGQEERTLPGWNYRIAGFLPQPPSFNYWYLVQDRDPSSLAYFVGYDPPSKRVVGYVGKKGYRTAVPATDEQFLIRGTLSGAYSPSIGTFGHEPYRYGETERYLFLVADGALHKIDLAAQSVDAVAMPDRVISIGKYEQLRLVEGKREPEYERRILVRLPNALHILTLEGEPLQIVPLAESFQDRALTLLGTTTGEFLLEARSMDDHYAPLDLYRLSPDGEVLKHQQASVSKRPEPPGVGTRFGMAAVLSVPMLYAFLAYMDEMGRLDEGRRGVAEAASAVIANNWAPVIALLLVSGASALYAYRRQRGIDPRNAKGWAIFVFLLGPPGLVGYLLHRPWPARSVCSYCGKSVPRDRATCLACGEEFLAPALRGIEVFA